VPLRRTALGACVAGLVSLAAASSAVAAAPASDFNDVMGNNSECIPLRDNTQPAEMWAFNGADTGYRFNNISWTNAVCPNGYVRVQQYPPITAGGKTMYFQRGNSGSTTTDTNAIRHGHIHVSDLSRRPAEIPLSDPRIYPNARPCPETATIYYNDPEGKASKGSIPSGMWYKPPSSSSDGDKWNHYGDPPQTQGSNHFGHYNYLVWNWMWTDNTGGGQVETVLVKNETIRRCDVASITSPSYGLDGQQNGEVRGVYGKVSNSSGSVVYGWFVHSWRRYDLNGGAWSYLVSSTPVPA
jgi:hypothetical protein